MQVASYLTDHACTYVLYVKIMQFHRKKINEARKKIYTLAVSKKTLFERMRSNLLFFYKKGEKSED